MYKEKLNEKQIKVEANFYYALFKNNILKEDFKNLKGIIPKIDGIFIP